MKTLHSLAFSMLELLHATPTPRLSSIPPRPATGSPVSVGTGQWHQGGPGLEDGTGSPAE